MPSEWREWEAGLEEANLDGETEFLPIGEGFHMSWGYDENGYWEKEGHGEKVYGPEVEERLRAVFPQWILEMMHNESGTESDGTDSETTGEDN